MIYLYIIKVKERLKKVNFIFEIEKKSVVFYIENVKFIKPFKINYILTYKHIIIHVLYYPSYFFKFNSDIIFLYYTI